MPDETGKKLLGELGKNPDERRKCLTENL
jgi:hypothetical protein